MDKMCSLCGGTGHTVTECHWTKVRQSRRASLVEAVVNTFVGLLLAMFVTQAICWVYEIPMTWGNNFIITFWMTVVSVGRGYILRRMWNAEFWRSWPARWRYRNIDPELCCCGAQITEGGELCHHGGCRSAKEYAITKATQGSKK